MVQFCSRCQRGNPDQAVFCYFDGIPLRKGAVAPSAAVDPGAELVFPSGRRCRNLDDLVEGCQTEWDAAGQLLQKGDLVKFLQRLGRVDLVNAIREGQPQPDADIALYNFLHLLPASAGEASRASAPRLDLQPRRVLLKKVAVGDRPQVQLTIVNQGRGVLQGKILVSEGQEWLGFGAGRTGDGRQAGVKTQREQQLVLRIDTRMLIGGQTYTGRLTVITNGGIAEVPVRLDLAAAPFEHAPYKGASTPRGLAQRMLTNPKPAVALLESGEISRWFAANGWNYPVEGEPARGVAAVQQFFECLGLSKPPPLTLSDTEIRLQCLAPQTAAGEVALRTNSRKWVYAQVGCDAPWVRVTTPSVSGPQQARIAFEVDSGHPDLAQARAKPGRVEIHQATLALRANGNQKLSVRIKVEIKRPAPSVVGRWLKPVLMGAVLALVLRLLLVFPADIYTRLLVMHGAGTLEFWKTPPGAENVFLRSFVLATWWVGGLLGVFLVVRKGGKAGDLACGLLAGCGAGLALASILGCMLILLDGVPRTLAVVLAGVFGDNLSGLAGTVVWIGTAMLGWAILGGCLGLGLSLLGSGGWQLLNVLAAPLAGLCRLCGLQKVATWLTARS
jgi:hypothetical protein